ncbi:AAA family ATPase [Haladaptatus sp. F3-133]|uniref:AAA family ATPase n=1 Tax=Halorutilus salinus TaxID=2487751 RepID=A0A9Q4C583_9EURY|nr:AAA family ATPase [Halorutilus salinus]MCX2819493.1 AAA family ATPase [Halorutilus salinus]
MNRDNVISDPQPLKPEYTPKNLVDRKEEKAVLTEAFSDITDYAEQNLYLHGPNGTGKTLLARKTLEDLPASTPSSYVDCKLHNTQYKALKQIYSDVSREEVGTGHHTSELQRKVQDRVSGVNTVIVLDDVDFLLQKDGDGLLYYLSRTKDVSLVVVSSNHADPASVLEERTYSSLHPRRASIEPYTGKQAYEILKKRAEKSLEKRSLHKNALTYIASKTQNATVGLFWLREAALNTDDHVSENLVKEVEVDAQARYVDYLLGDLTEHHTHVYTSIQELTSTGEETVQTGDVYKKYRETVGEKEAVSDRRLSDYIKQLELLNLIQAEYHYGGKKGKTREIRLRGLEEI